MERQYQTLTHYDHVLARPDSYVGSITPLTTERWLATKQGIERRNCRSIPALLKLFDEILMNARDNSILPHNPTTTIKIELGPDVLSVSNNGQCIPIKRQGGVYIPSLVFFKLLTSEHYDDSKKRLSAGLNGYGCKLVSIFSSSITVECHDPSRGLLLQQTYTNNMTVTEGPLVRKKKKHAFTTKVTFTPDTQFFPRWNNAVNQALFHRRVLDVAGTHPHVKVYLNGTRVPSGFKRYMALYPVSKHVVLPTQSWDVGLALSPNDSLMDVSFVNGIHTPKGGTHVTCITDQLTTHIQTILRKRSKSTSKLSKRNILHKLFVFINAVVESPHFGSQTKEEMTTEVEAPPTLTCAAVEKAIKTCGILAELEAWLAQKELSVLQKKMKGTHKKTIHGIPKLNDAQRAGTSESSQCSLILTEGDSAASMALAGLSVVGRKYFGVMPLKGKPLNVRVASKKMLLGNKEIQNLIKIMGLQLGHQYTDTRSLRYGHIIIMSDQDVDGFHIGGLLLNFLHHFWPSLASLNIVQRFMTPLLKVGRQEFFNLETYNVWKAADASRPQRRVKYYKGLGTSTNAEAQAYFRNLPRYLKQVTFDEQAASDLELVFGKQGNRKEWMRSAPTPLDYSVQTLTVHQLVHSELLTYAHASLQRAIPSMVDGLKESQRKILFGARIKVKTKEMKVAQLAAFIADRTEYTHGEQSLCQAITKMAQDFVGSNNVPLLQPNGQFGSRQQNGADSASPRYIYTQLQPYTQHLFPPSDDPLLTYRREEGTEVEPVHYVPVVPMLLVNGCNGIATGFRTLLLPCSLADVVANLQRMLRKQPLEPLVPTVRGFRGRLDDTMSQGTYTMQSPKKVSITELPIGKSILQYKTFLHGCDKVSRFEEHHQDDRIHFLVYLTEPSTNVVEDLRLVNKVNSSWVALNPAGGIQQYTSREALLREFFALRMDMYARRKAYQLEASTRRLEELRLEQCFIRAVLAQPRQPDLTSIPESYREKFRSLPMSRLEEASIARAQQEQIALRAAREELRATSLETLYERDLAALDVSKKRKR